MLKLPCPLPLLGSEPGSFTQLTVTQRLPAIVRRVIAENSFPPDINDKLERLANDLVDGYVPPLEDDGGADVAAWRNYISPYIGQRWVDIPWFVTETYLYRKIIEITGYFRPGEWQGADPFKLQKQASLETSATAIVALCGELSQWQQSPSRAEFEETRKMLVALLYFALWGNRVDLSLWSAFEANRSIFDIGRQQEHLLADDTPQVVNLLTSSKSKRIDLIADNAGFEFVCDLCLADFLLESGLASQVNLHLKPHPTFVSDATLKDFHDTLGFLAGFEQPQVLALGKRLQTSWEEKRLVCVEDWFWTSPLAGWEMPAPVREELARAGLTVVKGDANYRRLLGDRHWNFTIPLADIVCYLPAPAIALRTLKSEVAAGLDPAQVETLNRSHPDWLTNGQWGVIQFVEPRFGA